jgi:pimeloyl-ACP methyl ester carboxylesterase
MDSSLTHRFVDVNGVRLHIAEQGQGPLVLLLHGWPETRRYRGATVPCVPSPDRGATWSPGWR